MEPLTALGLAAAVVQFTDFGVRLLTDSVRIYQSVDGQTLQHVQLARISDDLSQLAGNIQEKAVNLTQVRQSLSPTERILVRLSEESQSISNQLSSILDRIRIARSSNSRIDLARESIFTALRSYRSNSQIATLRDSLFDIRQQMMMASLTVLWGESVNTANIMVQMSQQQSTMIDILGRIDHATQNLGQSVLTVPQLLAAPKSASESEMAVVNAIWNSTWTPRQPLTESVPAMLETVYFGTPEDERDKFSTVSIIESLLFEGFNHRETSIPQSHRRTFEWIFHPPAHGAKWSDFDGWLREQDSEVYWITGKAGAGKSTLMKHIIHHPTTRKQLEAWSNPLPLVTGSFYFWNAGSMMQKSPEGFLQILLYQFLCQVPRLTPKLLPRRWALFKIFGSNSLKVAPKWSMKELLEAISIFTTVYVGTELRLGLFIDGLDEIDGDYEELIRLIHLFHNRTGAKVCVSSRPENAFTDEYETNPSLRVQDLTRSDMESYVNDHFGANRAFRELQSAFSDEADLLKRNIVEKSEGVFMWLSLVVTTLLEGLTEGDIREAKDLQTALDELPKDLSELYQRIWTRIKPKHIEESSKMFQILRASEGPLDVVNLWLAENLGPLDFDAKTLNSDRRAYIHQLMRRRLSSKTRGLLEISPDGQVDYLHRSVWDWINPMWDEICRKTPPEFDPNLALLVAGTVNQLQVTVSDLQVTIDATKGELKEDDRYNVSLN